MSGVDDLVTWLRQQLDDDERVARAATSAPWIHHVAPDPSGPDHTLLTGEHGVISVGFMQDDPIRPADAEHIARHDPAQVLAEVDAKRRILDAYVDAVRMERLMDETDDDGKWDWLFKSEALEGAVKLLALPYADRPGYREEWRP